MSKLCSFLAVAISLILVSNIHAQDVKLELTIKKAKAIKQKEGIVGGKAARMKVAITVTNESKEVIGVGFSGMKFRLFDKGGEEMMRLINDAEAKGVADAQPVQPGKSVTLSGTLTLVSNKVDPDQTYKLVVQSNDAKASATCKFEKPKEKDSK